MIIMPARHVILKFFFSSRRRHTRYWRGLEFRRVLFRSRVYDELLRERGVHSAQVLLTFFDMRARRHYLNARQTLRKLLDWGVVPVINENDTTTTDEISFGDNDFQIGRASCRERV